MMRRILQVVCWGVLMAGLVACSADTKLGGVKIPNARPDTRMVAQPPTLLEAGFAVEFFWTGSDPDGKLKGYEWKVSDNGLDGISPRDTLTVDPLTGAVLHPWRFTTATDSVFILLADQPGFPGDPETDPRSFRSHSLFIRAVDEDGAKDPSPAYISFTSTTLVPTCQVDYKNLTSSKDPKKVPPTVNIGWVGEDPDFDLKTPTKVRYLWKKALDSAGEFVTTRYAYENTPGLISFDDPDWSDWRPYSADIGKRKVKFRNQENRAYYFFAVQVQDTAGAVSVGLGWQQEVAHLTVKEDFFKPVLTVDEPFLNQGNQDAEVASGQPINFVWLADPSGYGGEIVSYRHGWDLTNPDNPADPQWAVPAGTSPQNLFDTERVFTEGTHTFYLRVVDDSDFVLLFTRNIQVVPYVDPEFQRPLLVVDQVIDQYVDNWRDRQNVSRNKEVFRNAYWRFLDDIQGGVSGIDWSRDWVEDSDQVYYSDIVQYSAVLCYAEYNDSQLMFDKFRPEGNQDKFVWLTPYQYRGGNFFLVGQASMESFLPNFSRYAVPIIFDAKETTLLIGGQDYTIGYGTRSLPDGTEVYRGPLMYPYATAGITALDWTAPAGKYIYGRPVPASQDRRPACVGLKGLALDPAFKLNHGIGPGVVPDTMWTNRDIDWHDYSAVEVDTLKLGTLNFTFTKDEFVNESISERTGIILQNCDSTDAPNGQCIEPMFKGIARFDWLRELRWRQGDSEWPSGTYSTDDLVTQCGTQALTDYNGRPRSSAWTNGRTFGYFSYKMVAEKPGLKRADVYWGFDPYRFDESGTKKTIRWVLSYFGIDINQ